MKAEIQKNNEWFFLALANHLRKGAALSKLINQAMEESVLKISKTSLFFLEKDIGILQIKNKDASLLRNNVGSFDILISKIADNITGGFHEKSVIEIISPFKASFEIIDPGVISKQKTVLLKINQKEEKEKCDEH